MALLFFGSGSPFNLDRWPTVGASPVADSTLAVNVGRKHDGTLSFTDLYVGNPVQPYRRSYHRHS